MKRKRVSSSTYQMGMVYGGLLVATINPVAGAITAGVLYKLYKSRKAEEEVENSLARDAEREQFKTAFYRRQKHLSYEAYLSSTSWQTKRASVVSRAAGRCEHSGCTRLLQEVHHLRYPRVWGNEPIEWLVGLCEQHHREAHGFDEPTLKR